MSSTQDPVGGKQSPARRGQECPHAEDQAFQAKNKKVLLIAVESTGAVKEEGIKEIHSESPEAAVNAVVKEEEDIRGRGESDREPTENDVDVDLEAGDGPLPRGGEEARPRPAEAPGQEREGHQHPGRLRQHRAAHRHRGDDRRRSGELH